VSARLNEGREGRVVDTDLLGDPVERLDEAAIVLVDARELPAHEWPSDPGLRTSRPAAIKEIGGRVPEEGTGMEPPHERKRQNHRIFAQILMEDRVEDDAVTLQV
jgi:hypothetical protein